MLNTTVNKANVAAVITFAAPYVANWLGIVEIPTDIQTAIAVLASAGINWLATYWVANAKA